MLLPSTFSFLSLLHENNNREWFEANRALYETAHRDFEAFVEKLRAAMLPLIPELETQTAKSLLFRIYRDVRFSKDKTPYKTHFSAYFSRAGKKAVDAGYYLHLTPGGSHLSVGMWEPQKEVLKAVRQEIDYSFEELQAIIGKASFRKTFGEMKGDLLRNTPPGYAADNPAAEVLKHKSFLFSHPLADDFFTQKSAVEKLRKLAEEAKPFVAFLNRSMDV